MTPFYQDFNVSLDRDAYVFIDEDEVTDGHLHNFNKYDFSYVSPVGTEYAYDSIMHYGPYSFNKDPNKSGDRIEIFSTKHFKAPLLFSKS